MQTTTPAQFRRKAERAFRDANPDAGDMEVTWERTGPIADCKGGPGRMRSGEFLATAPGFGTVRVFASESPLGFRVTPSFRVAS